MIGRTLYRHITVSVRVSRVSRVNRVKIRVSMRVGSGFRAGVGVQLLFDKKCAQ